MTSPDITPGAPDDSSIGRLATLADPTGSLFKIVAGNSQGAAE